uniref:Uncharacterized protein n=1 Tax=Lotharella globosa TaxID=91324 RepID=A0A7S4DW60_9EUKA|mmetsp:Transcript_14332/g.28915  ORF Transcript_14332/g.28915 Transcript_14332/m.28915 type:complete len:203 (+) Transcript_14332:73-681(+)
MYTCKASSSFAPLGVMLALLLCGSEALQNDQVEGKPVEEKKTGKKGKAPMYGFASACELEVVKFYCHITPDDPFCEEGLHETCGEIKDQCRGFRSRGCEDHVCCKCAFAKCPLERKGCDLIMRKCTAGLKDMDDNGFMSYVEIAKIEGIVKPGKVPIRINGPRPKFMESLSSSPQADASFSSSLPSLTPEVATTATTTTQAV